MITKTLYKYLKEDGKIALLNSKVVSYTPLTCIEADEGKLLTDGNIKSKSFLIEPSEVSNYYEIDDEEVEENGI
jgi:hypothetical protein